MIRNILRAWSDRLRARLIEIDGRPYLVRYLVARVAGCELYLHEFLTADGERHVHDHPWAWSASLLLAGGYVEEVLTAIDGYAGPLTCTRIQRAPGVNLVGRGFHRIAQITPGTWTIFAVGPRRKMWGFLEYDAERRATVYAQPFDYARAGDDLDWQRQPYGRELRAELARRG